MSLKFFSLTLILLLFLPVTFAVQSLTDRLQINNTLTYTIVKESVIVDHKIDFSEKQNGWEVILPLDSSAIEVKSHAFKLLKNKEYAQLLIGGLIDGQINKPSKISEISLKYITDSLVEKTKDNYFIVNLAKIEGDKKLTVILPEGATLKYDTDSIQSSVIPYTQNVLTDGKRIIISWDKEELADAESILIIYQMPKGMLINSQLMLIFSIIFFISVFIAFFIFRHLPKKNMLSLNRIKEIKNNNSDDEDNTITKNLFDEEKSIINVLLNEKDNEMWQKQLLSKTGITKVKLSRKLRALEQKGLIEKIPFGNTNKIKLKNKQV